MGPQFLIQRDQHEVLTTVISDLNVCRTQIHEGVFDVCLRGFGSEYAGGAFYARFHFQQLEKLYITCKQQSKFADFPLRLVADEVTIHLQPEPVLLDNLKAHMGNCAEAWKPYFESLSVCGLTNVSL